MTNNVGEEYIKVIHDMYEGCTASVRTLPGSTESFEVKVCLHQGSALSQLLFITAMDFISEDVGRGPSQAVLFADRLVICENTREQAEEQLELWRKIIESKGLRVSRSKTEYLPPSSCLDGKVTLGGEDIQPLKVSVRCLMQKVDPPQIAKKNRVQLAWDKLRRNWSNL